DAGKLHSFGRGLIFGNLVFWPTSGSDPNNPPQERGVPAELRVLDAGEGQVSQSLNLPARRLKRTWGNLAYADGLLAVTDRNSLAVHVAPSLSVQQRKEHARANPDSAQGHVRLALALIDAGDLESAVEEWKRVEAAAEDSTSGRSQCRLA